MSKACHKKTAQLLTGPHWCASLGNKTVNLVFSTVIAEAERNGGVLSVEQLVRCREQMTDEEQSLAPLYEQQYNDCVKCKDGDKAPSFDRRTMLQFHLSVLVRDSLPKEAERRLSAHPGKLTATACQTVVRYFIDLSGTQIQDKLVNAYHQFAASKGCGLEASDLLADTTARRIIGDFLKDIHSLHRKQPQFALNLLHKVNTELERACPEGLEKSQMLSAHEIEQLLEHVLVLAEPSHSN